MNSFNQLNLKRLIPLIAISATASGCAGSERKANRSYCKEYETCDPGGFSEIYDSVGECVKVNTKYEKARTYEFKKLESKECAQAYEDYLECLGETISCDDFDSSGSGRDYTSFDPCVVVEAEYENRCFGEEY